MPENLEAAAQGQSDQQSRELPKRIVVPPIKGEMVHLRPAAVEDLDRMDAIEAYVGASGITGKDRVAERGAVRAWVRRSVAWSQGEAPSESGVGDPESRRTIAWSIVTEADHDGDGETDAADSDNVIGMIFLIDIDGWARSARIQVVLGKDYRGRGYSRDIMPRVMTYGLAPEPAGLGMHRIWVAVPEQNTFGMHVIEDNPGVKEALSAREHSIAIRLNEKNASKHDAEGTDVNDAAAAAQSVQKASSDGAGDVAEAVRKDAEGAEPARQSEHDDRKSVTGDADAENSWPYTAGERKTSKEAWWRTLGRGRKRDVEGK